MGAFHKKKKIDACCYISRKSFQGDQMRNFFCQEMLD